jgi:hypothetical protein
VHPDSTPASNSKRSGEDLEATGAMRLPYPVDLPGIVPSAFYRFGNLKEKWQSVAVTDRDNRISAITEIFTDTAQDELIAGYQN